MMAVFLLALAMQADAAPPPSAEAARPQASGATWVSQPSQAQFPRVYPTQAEWDSAPGRAVLDRVFTAAGRLSNCAVSSEEPTGRHFGAAALKLAPFFRAVAIPAGASLEGKPISLPVTFDAKLDGSEPAAEARLPASRGWKTAPGRV